MYIQSKDLGYPQAHYIQYNIIYMYNYIYIKSHNVSYKKWILVKYKYKYIFIEKKIINTIYLSR